MAVTKTARLGLTRWSDDNDPWLRSDWDGDNAQLEALAAMAEQGLASARPTAAKTGRFYLATDTDDLSYDTGTKWITLRAAGDGTVTLGTGIVTNGDGSNVYRRNGLGTLLVGVATDAAGPTANRVLLNVPAGYRPPRNVPVLLRTASGALRANLATTGDLTVVNAGAAVVTPLTGSVTYPTV